MQNTHLRDKHFQFENDASLLQRELEEAHNTIRNLLRQIQREQGQCGELSRVYNEAVTKLVAITRSNAELEHDRDQWRQRVEKTNTAPIPLDITSVEARAIRKAIARLHHPDMGGDAERMKVWNSVLDQLED